MCVYTHFIFKKLKGFSLNTVYYLFEIRDDEYAAIKCSRKLVSESLLDQSISELKSE